MVWARVQRRHAVTMVGLAPWNTLRAERRRRLRRRRRACVRVVLVVCLGWRPGARGGVGYGCAGYHGAGRLC